MRHIYLVPAAVIDGLVADGLRIGGCQCCACLGDMRLVVVDNWGTDSAQDSFEAHPDVVQFYPWDAEKPVPAALVAASATARSPASHRSTRSGAPSGRFG